MEGVWPRGHGRCAGLCALHRRQHRPRTVAEPDPPRAFGLAVAAQDHAVAVLQEGARLAIGQRERHLAALAQLQQRAALVGPRAALRAAAHQVARLQVASVAGVVGQQLRGRPVSVGVRAGRHTHGRLALRAHLARLDPHLEADGEGPALAVAGGVEIGQRLRVGRVAREGHPKRRQRLHGDDPRRDRGGEVLGQERAQRLVLPGLHVARRPVVEQRGTEQRGLGLGHVQRHARRVGRAHEQAQLQLVVEAARWREDRRVALAPDLSPRPRKTLAARADGRTAPVVPDRHPLVVGQQRVVGPEQLAHRGGVMDARVEVGVVADVARQRHLGLVLRHQQRAGLGMPQRRGARGRGRQALEQRVAQSDARRATVRHEAVQVAQRQRAQQHGDLRVELTQRVEVEHLVADGHAHPQRVLRAGTAEPADREVLDREVGVRRVGRHHPAGGFQRVREVEHLRP
jgi:hypothetical protein